MTGAEATAIALEAGLPLLPEGEVLFVNLDPRVALDVESTVRMTWPVVERMNANPGQGFYLGRPTERPMAVDPRVFAKRV